MKSFHYFFIASLVFLSGCSVSEKSISNSNASGINKNTNTEVSDLYRCDIDEDCVAILQCSCAWDCVNKEARFDLHCPDQAQKCNTELFDRADCECQNNKCQVRN